MSADFISGLFVGMGLGLFLALVVLPVVVDAYTSLLRSRTRDGR